MLSITTRRKVLPENKDLKGFFNSEIAGYQHSKRFEYLNEACFVLSSCLLVTAAHNVCKQSVVSEKYHIVDAYLMSIEKTDCKGVLLKPVAIDTIRDVVILQLPDGVLNVSLDFEFKCQLVESGSLLDTLTTELILPVLVRFSV